MNEDTIDQRSETSEFGLPSPFKELLVLRCVGAEAKPSKSSGQAMVVLEWEIVGAPDGKGSTTPEIEVWGKKYKIAGARIKPTYFSLSKKAIEKYYKFLDKAEPGIEHKSVNKENPPLQYARDNLLMEAIVMSMTDYQRKAISDEEKKVLIDNGKEPVGEFITDSDGNKIPLVSSQVYLWWRKYTGEVKNPF